MGNRDEKERGDRLKCVVYESTRAPRIYMTRCPKVCGKQVSRLRFSDIIRLTANDKDFSLRSK